MATESASHTHHHHGGRAGDAVEKMLNKTGLRHDPAYQGHAVNASDTTKNVADQPDGIGTGPQIVSTSESTEIIAGPLLNYKHMSGEHTPSPQWHGSILIVTTPGNIPGEVSVHSLGPTGSSSGTAAPSASRTFKGEKLYEDPHKGFWRFLIDVPFEEQESTWEYSIPKTVSATTKQPLDSTKKFVVPSKHESMRIMFHSCNGFSVGTDMETWTGPTLWHDVLRVHAAQPIHVMIGGGDQIYNDNVRVDDGPLKVGLAANNACFVRSNPSPSLGLKSTTPERGETSPLTKR